MNVARIWASEDGESHVAEEELAMGEPYAGITAVTQSDEVRALSVAIRRFEPGFESNWHPTGTNGFAVLWIAGAVEYDVSDGGVVRVSAEGLRYATFEDRTGRGHRVRVDPTEGVTIALITLP